MILCGHFLYHPFREHVPFAVFYGIEPLFIDGVDIFFLISGWFGIRFSMKSLYRFIVMVAGFIAINIAGLYIIGEPMSLRQIVPLLLFPIGQSRYWFVMVYMLLMILAPLLNAGIKAMGSRNFAVMLIILTVLNLWDCWIGGNYTNINGYNISQAIWLYCLSYWLRRKSEFFDKIKKEFYLIGFFAIIALMTASMLITHFRIPLLYNSPFVVFSSVSLLLYFSRLKIKSAGINRLATAVFGCYLLQDGFIGHIWGYEAVREYGFALIHHYSLWEGIGLLLLTLSGIIILIWILSYIITTGLNRFSDITYIPLARRVKKLLHAEKVISSIQPPTDPPTTNY